MTNKRIENARTITEVSEGKITIEDSSREATLSVNKTCRNQPLSSKEEHLTLFVRDGGFSTEIILDGEQMDALADAIYNIQTEYSGESDE